jgi:hypothetical protein
MISNRIGTLAEKIVAVKIAIDGTVTPFVRRRLSGGRMVDVKGGCHGRIQHIQNTEFAVRVNAGHSGVITIGSSMWLFQYPLAVIPLGKGDPFEESDVPQEIRALASSSSTEEVRFRFAAQTLTWESNNISGQAVVNESYPELVVTLRLPPGNEGEFVFESPLFARDDNVAAHVLTAN